MELVLNWSLYLSYGTQKIQALNHKKEEVQYSKSDTLRDTTGRDNQKRQYDIPTQDWKRWPDDAGRDGQKRRNWMILEDTTERDSQPDDTANQKRQTK